MGSDSKGDDGRSKRSEGITKQLTQFGLRRPRTGVTYPVYAFINAARNNIFHVQIAPRLRGIAGIVCTQFLSILSWSGAQSCIGGLSGRSVSRMTFQL